MSLQAYAELQTLSAFSFRHSVAEPQALVTQAHALGYQALAITDEMSLAGAVRAYEAAERCGMHLIIGSTCYCADDSLPAPLDLVFLVPDQTAYAQLCRLITQARRRAVKGSYIVTPSDLEADLSSLLVIWKPRHDLAKERLIALTYWLQQRFEDRLWLGATRLLQPTDSTLFATIDWLSQSKGLPVVACGHVCMVARDQKPMLDVMCALKHHCTIDECGLMLEANAERHLRPLGTLEKLYPRDWLDETVHVAKRCHFSMRQLTYRYPKELVPEHLSASEHLKALSEQGLLQRYGAHIPDQVRDLVAHELALIEEMQVEAFFLTVHDLVSFAKSRGILCQGRGSAANSAVCFCLNITEVDPAKQSLLFERFLSKERDEPPDIDVDFEHERREEVLQYIYQKYGRERAALAATVTSYRPKSALKDVGRALGFGQETLNALTRSLAWWDTPDQWPERLQAAGVDPENLRAKWLLRLTQQFIGLPRHLSQHVGGMVISDQPLYELVPIENAAMAGRTIIQWDKDDLGTLGLLKVDCLALGMLTVLRKALHSIDPSMRLADIPKEDPATYEMLCKADAVGVFQVESRAQMAMLPRLKPRCFYDLVVEIALVRPGPIQGEMVHPYLKRRQNPTQIDYPDPKLSDVLKRTLGVPIFQEQVMQIAMVAADFTPGQADQLRRAMAAWKRRGGLAPFREPLITGMLNNGYSKAFAEKIYGQIQGFGDYGFPESHAASFALLTYFSAWLKCHHPAAFTCALLNSQPMGFYAPAQLIQDAKRHGVMIEPVGVHESLWETIWLDQQSTSPRIRLGFNQIKGLPEKTAERLLRARIQKAFVSLNDLTQRAGLHRDEVRLLTQSGALSGLIKDRRDAHWQALASHAQGDLLANAPIRETKAKLKQTPNSQLLVEDYATLGYCLSQHPVEYLRPHGGHILKRSDQLPSLPNSSRQIIEVMGLVTHRQRPGTASGVIFLSLEDEAGLINVIVWPKIAMRDQVALLQGQILRVRGQLQRRDGSIHIIAQSIIAEDQQLARLLGQRH